MPDYNNDKQSELVTALHSLLLPDSNLETIIQKIQSGEGITFSFEPFYEILPADVSHDGKLLSHTHVKCLICATCIHKHEIEAHLVSRHGNIKFHCPVDGCTYTCLQKGTFSRHFVRQSKKATSTEIDAAHTAIYQLYKNKRKEQQSSSTDNLTGKKAKGSLLLLFAKPLTENSVT